MPARKLAPNPTSITMPVPTADPELSASVKRALAAAQAIRVTTTAGYEAAADMYQSLSAREDEVAAEKKKLWDPLAKLTKNVQALFNPPLKGLAKAKEIVRDKMGVYALEQRNIQLAAQQQADQAAEEARDKLLAKADRAANAGNDELAAVLEARAESIEAPTVESQTPYVAGLKLVSRWAFEVTDAAKLPREYLMVDEKAIRGAVNGSNGTVKIPGVRIWSTLKPQD